MKEVSVGNKKFRLYLDEVTIQQIVKNLAKELSENYKNKTPLFLPILNGSFMFAADLFKNLDFLAEISFIKVASYEGMQSEGQVHELIGINPQTVKGRTVIILEDIIETGNSLNYVVNKLKEYHANDIQICCLFSKPECLKNNITVNYVGKEIANDFIIGYGMDYNGLGRNLKEIYQLND